MLHNLFLVLPFLLLIHVPVVLYARDIQSCVQCQNEVNEISVLHREYIGLD